MVIYAPNHCHRKQDHKPCVLTLPVVLLNMWFQVRWNSELIIKNKWDHRRKMTRRILKLSVSSVLDSVMLY